MRAGSFITIAALALVQGAPTPDYTYAKQKLSAGGVCRTTTWSGATSDKSPTIDDCTALRNQLLQAKAQGYVINGFDKDKKNDGTYLGLVSQGTCNFAVQVFDGKEGIPVITNSDIADLLRDAMSKFGANGHVGASGQVPCNEDWVVFPKRIISWKIFAYGE
ncbi:putative necrosis-inducing factor-domain-containing protein [Nemania abortiva]|nr:putative necrosis-inducing factor-domain-containing protein [Nemania abortiva]